LHNGKISRKAAPGRRFSLLNLSGVGLAIEDATGIPTQVVLRRSLPADFARRIADGLIAAFRCRRHSSVYG
jgi:hypothetical protein